MQEIFGTGPCLRAACGATDLSNLFVSGSIPSAIATPEPATFAALGIGLFVLGTTRRLKRGKRQ